VSKIHNPQLLALHPHTVFRAFKYTIYFLLMINTWLFFQEDFLASQEVFSGPIGFGHLAEAFTATLDTAAWVVLLLLFELETAVISDDKLKGNLKWVLMVVRAACYTVSVWAFYGYVTKFMLLSDTVPFAIDNVCSLVGSGFTWVQDLDEYLHFDQASCQALQGQALMQIRGTEIIGTVDALDAARYLTVIDVINAADWLVIVVMLEVEVYMQLRNLLTDRLIKVAKIVKVVLYTTLLFCAVYWGFLGDFLDFWDAFLWLVAFIFIEMNIFQWHEEIEEEKELQHETANSAF